MARANRVCATQGCATISPTRHCPAHQLTTAQRGYGHTHRQTRQAWTPHVEAGEVNCARCGAPILPGEPWDLDHNDHDRSQYNGPAHTACNRDTQSPDRTAART